MSCKNVKYIYVRISLCNRVTSQFTNKISLHNNVKSLCKNATSECTKVIAVCKDETSVCKNVTSQCYSSVTSLCMMSI